jgi:peptide/nickel transport system permease protein
MTVLEQPAAPTEKQPRMPRLRGLDPIAVVCLSIICLVVLMALLAPLLSPYDPDAVDILSANQAPSSAHLLGTDSLGRDVWTRLLYGARLSLFGPAVVTIIATLVGTALAVWGAWREGWVDRLLVRVLDVLFAFPALLFGVLAVAVLGQGLLAPVLALSIAYIPYVARVIRSVAVRQRNLPYIEACQLMGYSSWRSSFHLLKNIRLYVVAQATLTFGYALIDLAAISFIGLGVQPPTAEWGLMVSNGASSVLNGSPWESLSAGVMIIVTVVAFNVLGERIAARAENS